MSKLVGISAILGGFIGLAFGAAVGGGWGALVGLVVGLVVALSTVIPVDLWSRKHRGAEVMEHQELDIICFPKGQVAHVSVVGDPDTGKAVDIERCSMFADGRCACDKTCLHMLNDGGTTLHHSPTQVKAVA
jgi:hypothetical protein